MNARTVLIVRTIRVGALFVLIVGLTFLARSASSGASSAPTPPSNWVDQNVTFVSGGVTVYATYRHPESGTATFPAVLLISGSGPTDRDGNSPGNDNVNTLQTLADWLSQDGVASLRYDKLGSGLTGLGTYAPNPNAIGIAPYQQESRSAFLYLSSQKNVNDRELGVFGHSEGALFALLLATRHDGLTPPIRALGLIEPLSQRTFDLNTDQIDAGLTYEVNNGSMSAATEASIQSAVAQAVAQMRTTGTVPVNLPDGLSDDFNASNVTFLSQLDQYDPAVLTGALPEHTAVLFTCSNDDVVISCGEVNGLAIGLVKSDSYRDFVHLTNVDHILRVDTSLSGTDYSDALPFSGALKLRIREFVKIDLRGTLAGPAGDNNLVKQ